MPPIPAPLQVRNLTRRFGAFLAVDGLSLEAERGEILGLLGPNGAGKTTSIHMMVGLLEPTEGDVLVEGHSIRSARRAAQGLIGVCPQENILWEKLTCCEQLEFVGANYGLSHRQARQRGAELLDALGLSARADELAGRLSGGMKRRLNLALALIHDPPIVFLDEPEAGLDPQSRVLVRDVIRQLARRKTVILTTHNMDEAERLAERVAILDHGRLLTLDTPAALKKRLGADSVLEVELENSNQPESAARASRLLELLHPEYPDALVSAGRLSLRAAALSERLPAILATLAAAGCQAGSIQIRAVSLEDVFLTLTGRGLRE